VLEQYESNTGEKYKNASPEIQQEVENGVQNLWSSFKLVGEDAKVLEVSSSTKNEPADVNDESDLSNEIRKFYERYVVQRDGFGKNHRQALDLAFYNAKGLKAIWGDKFRSLYAKR
jgi:hypothetical protein